MPIAIDQCSIVLVSFVAHMNNIFWSFPCFHRECLQGNNDGGLEKPFTIFSLKSCWHFYPKIFWYYLRVNYQKHSTNQKYHEAAEWELLATEWILDVEKHCDNLIRSCQALSKHLSNCAEASGGLHAQESPLLRPSSPFRDYSVGSSIRFVLTNLLNRIKYWYNTTI